MPVRVWQQHLEKIGSRCSRMGAGRASGRTGSCGQEEAGVGEWGGGLMALWGEHLAALFPPILQGRCYYFCKLEQPNFSRIPESVLCVGTIKHRVELGRYPERPPAGQKYALLWAKHPRPGRNQCTQTRVFSDQGGIESRTGRGAVCRRKPHHEESTIC